MAEPEPEMVLLKELNVENSKYYRQHPKLIAELRELEKLSIGYYSRYTVIYLPQILPKLYHLQCLNISHCYLHEFPEVITQVTTLQELDIKGNKNIYTLPNSLVYLTKLCKFDASGCGLTEFPDVLTELKSLESLNLSDMRGIELLPSSFAQLSQMQALDVSWCD